MKQQLIIKQVYLNLAAVCILSLFFLTSFTVLAQSSKISKVAINTINNGQFKNPDGFIEYLPANYDSRTDWPVLIWHHGLGKGGSGSIEDLEKLKNHAIMQWLKTHDVPFVVLSPQDAGGYFGGGRMELFYKWAKGAYKNKTNTKAYHISVLSASGAGLSTFLEDNSIFAQEVATITINSALTGTGNNKIYTNVVNNNTKVWFHHGNTDNTVGYGAPLNFFKGIINKCGGPNEDKYRYTMYSGMGHSAWNEVYDDSGISKNKLTGSISGGNYGDYYNWTSGSWYDWMLQNAKDDTLNIPVTPIVEAGSNQNIDLPANATALSGTILAGQESNLDLLWEKISGPNSFQIENETSKNATISQLVEGTYILRFIATTDQGITASDELKVTVNTSTIIEKPTNIYLDNFIIPENNLAGFSVGKLSTNSASPYLLELVSGNGDQDNSVFSISGDKLIIDVSTDFDIKNNYHIRIKASNEAGSVEKAFTIKILAIEEEVQPEITSKINFGRNNSVAVTGWNNLFLNNPIVGGQQFNLTDLDGEPLNWKLRVSSNFLSTPNEIGPNTGNNSGKYPDNVVKHSWMDRYGAEVEIYGLDSDKHYLIKVFSNTQNSQALMQCSVNGQLLGESVNVRNNAVGSEYEFIATNISPLNGVIKVRINGDNTHGRNYGYLTAMTISEKGNPSARFNQINLARDKEITSFYSLRIFPNPSNTGVFNLAGEDNLMGQNYQIMNMQGKTIQSGKLESKLKINAAVGIYLLNIPSTNKQIRLIVK